MKANEIMKEISLALLLVVVCILTQKAPAVLAEMLDLGVEFKQISKGYYKGEVMLKPDKVYYLSLGRPRTGCSISSNKRVIDSNVASNPELKNKLILGAPFLHRNKTGLEIKCVNTELFSPKLSHKPIVIEEINGPLMQVLRTFSELILGPLSAFLLFVFSVFFILVFPNYKDSGLAKFKKRVFVFSIVAFIYSLSLSYYPMLFLETTITLPLHVILKLSFSLFLLLSLSTSRTFDFLLILCHATMIVSVFLFPSFSELTIWDIYRSYFFFFPLAAISCFTLLGRSDGFLSKVYLVRPLCLAWSSTQILDAISIYNSIGVYYAPTVLAMVSILLVIIINQAQKIARKEDSCREEIVELLKKNGSPSEKTEFLLELIKRKAGFPVGSAYLDAYLTGRNPKPKEVFERAYISSSGEPFTEENFNRIYLEESSIMNEAIKSGQVIYSNKRGEKSQYVVIPIGDLGTLNFSCTQPISAYEFQEKISLCRGIFPAISGFAKQIESMGHMAAFSVNRLKVHLGLGDFEKKVGAVFLDINNFSSLSREFGPSFENFLEECYFPAIVRHVGLDCHVESMKGDELHLLIFGENFTDDIDRDNFLSCIARLVMFQEMHSAEICHSSGFPRVTFSAGITAGRVSIRSEESKVKVLGDCLNIASRLMGVAPSSSFLVSESTKEKFEFEQMFELSDYFPVLSKKDLINCYKIYSTKAEAKAV